MPNLRDIRRRIRSVKNTAQITRAMQLVAASKMKRAQDAAQHGRAYAELLAEMLLALSTRIDLEKVSHPLLEARPVKHRGLLVVGTDKGLCGPLNSNLFRLLPPAGEAVKYVTVGRKATQFVARSGRALLADFAVTDRVRFNEVRRVVEFLLKAHADGEIDTIEILYADFINTLKQEPVLQTLVPIANLKETLDTLHKNHPGAVSKLGGALGDERPMVFEPAPEELVAALLGLFVKREAFQAVLEAKASEHSARMVAMKTATDNAKNLAADLTLSYNKARQAAITQEILEIAAATASNS